MYKYLSEINLTRIKNSFVKNIHSLHNENSMSKEIAKKRAAALRNLWNTREKQKQKYVSKCIYTLSTRD